MTDDSRPFAPDWRIAPGELLKEALAERGYSDREACIRLSWTPRQLGKILAAEAPITFELAADLARVFENSVSYWLALQKLYDEPLPGDLPLTSEWVERYRPGAHFRVTGDCAGLIVRVALGMGRFGRTTLSVPAGSVLTCAGGIVGDDGPTIGWRLEPAQRAEAERVVNQLRERGHRQGFAELASELVSPGKTLGEIVEPIAP